LNSAMGTIGEPVNRNRTIINLAYEGVLQRAIARALQLPANEVGEVVAEAVARGIIVGPSESEWPQGSVRPGIQPLPDLRSMKGRCWRRHKAWR
jgi:hypothetical protein